MFDTLIRHGKIYDGSGSPWMYADVGLKGDRIVAVGAFPDAAAKQIIEAKGYAVAPGFIDCHCHTDFTLMACPGADSSLHQGVTTEIVGNCGLGYAPVTDINRAAVQKMADLYMPGVKVNWQTVAQYLDRLQATAKGTNLAIYALHGPLRRSVVGMANRPSTPDELQAIERGLCEALDAGAIGVSFGLEYMPGRTAGHDELLSMCRIAAGRNKLTAWHMRNRDRRFEESTAEVISLAREAGAAAQVSHLSAKPGSLPRAWNRCMEQIELARAQGMDILADQIPFAVGPGLITNILPDWVYDGGLDSTLRRLRDPETRARLKKDCDRYWLMIAAGEWEKVTLTAAKMSPQYCGMTFAEIAKQRGGDPFDAIFDVLADEGEGMDQVWVNGELFTEGQVREWICHRLIILASDGWAAQAEGPSAALANHPNCFGWTAEILGHWVRDAKIMSAEEAIRKMTSYPAARFGLRDRGLVRPGMMADVVVFDEDRVANRATYAQPHCYPVGFQTVIVNGHVALHEGELTGERRGLLLRA